MGTFEPCPYCRGTGKFFYSDGTQGKDCVFCDDSGVREIPVEDKWYQTDFGMITCCVLIFLFIGAQYIFLFPALFGW